MGKVKLTLTVDEDVIEKARRLGLNISKVCENALIDMIGRIESPNRPERSGSSFNASSQEGLNGASGGIRTRDQQLTRLPLRPG